MPWDFPPLAQLSPHQALLTLYCILCITFPPQMGSGPPHQPVLKAVILYETLMDKGHILSTVLPSIHEKFCHIISWLKEMCAFPHFNKYRDHTHRTSSKNSAPLHVIIRHSWLNDWKIVSNFWQRLSCVCGINRNRMCERWILTSKNWVKLECVCAKFKKKQHRSHVSSTVKLLIRGIYLFT